MFFVIHDKCDEIFHRRLRSFLPSDCQFGLRYQRKEVQLVRFCHRAKPWGTGHAIMCCEKVINCDFCRTNANHLYGRDAIFQMAEFLKSSEKNLTFL
jgi:UTP-glucose-1-phosphate uridylyltransferase